MKCTRRATLSELLARPTDLLVLTGADDNGEKQGDPAENQSEDKGKAGDESKDSASGDSEKKDEGKQGEPDARDRTIANLEEERERNVKKRREAQDEAAELKVQIADLKKNGTTDEATKSRMTELETTVGSQSETISRLALENAFLRDNTYSWQNTSAALRLVDMDNVEIESDGKISGLKSALDKLAKDNPYLLKAAEEPKVEKKEEPKSKTGDAPQSKTAKTDSDTAAREAELRRKYPALRR